MNDSLTLLQTIVAVIVAILGLVGIVAAIYAYYSMSLSKAQIEALRGDRDDLTARVQRLEEKNTRLEAERKVEVTKNKVLEDKVSYLEGLVTHDAKIDELIKAVNDHDANVEIKFSQNLDETHRLITLVEQILEGEHHAG